MLKQERRAEQTGAAAAPKIRPGRGAKRPVSIWELLVWAFQVERVSIEFDELARLAGERPAVGIEYILMQRGHLGCAVDGGGRSDSHPDADMVASALAVLPEGCGGASMAIWIAELARAGVMPDWGSDLPPRCVPVGWRNCRYGAYAERTLWTGDARVARWPANHLGKGDGYVCLVRYEGDAREHAGRRREWLKWWGALLELRATFQTYGLSAFEVTDAMPPRAPWSKGS